MTRYVPRFQIKYITRPIANPNAAALMESKVVKRGLFLVQMLIYPLSRRGYTCLSVTHRLGGQQAHAAPSIILTVAIVYLRRQLKYIDFQHFIPPIMWTTPAQLHRLHTATLPEAEGSNITMTNKVTQPPTDMQTILIADDHPLFRDALRQAVESQMPDTRVEMAGDFNEVEDMISQNPDADLLLLDLTMPGATGFIGLIRLRNEYPALPVIIVSASDDPATIRRSLELGASGFIPKAALIEQICEAIGEVLAGNVWLPGNIDIDSKQDDEIAAILAKVSKLTPQQHRVLNMIGDGLLNKQIAFNLGVSEATVKAHVSAVLLKLEVDSRTQAVIQLSKLGGAFGSSTLVQYIVDEPSDGTR